MQLHPRERRPLGIGELCDIADHHPTTRSQLGEGPSRVKARRPLPTANRKQNMFGRRLSTQSVRPGDRPARTCWTCGTMGHIALHCPRSRGRDNLCSYAVSAISIDEEPSHSDYVVNGTLSGRSVVTLKASGSDRILVPKELVVPKELLKGPVHG